MDAGNFGAAPTTVKYQPWEKTGFMFEMMGRLGYDATTPGDLELIEGLEKMKELYASQPGIQVVSANLQDKSGNLIFPKSTVIQKGDVKFGITGVTGEAYYTFNMTRGKQKKDDFTFAESKQALRDVIPDLQATSDIVVALIHEGPGDVRRILDEVEGIDVAIVGHNPGYMFNPDRVGNTLLIRTGNRGQYFSVLQLTLGDNMEILDYNGEGKPLDTGIAKDPPTESVVTEWENDFDRRTNQAKRKDAVGQSMLQGTEKYVGAEVCARCHVDEYARWSETAHANAYHSLVEADKETAENCLECHVVGYGQHSGYEIEWLTDSSGNRYSGSDKVELRNVQCENCHGMGTFHGTDMMVKIPDEETCRTCHTGEFDKGFNYADALAKGSVH